MSGTSSPGPSAGPEAPGPPPCESTRPWRTTSPQPPASRPAGSGAVVDCAVYVDGHRQEVRDEHQALHGAEEQGGFVWLSLYAPTEAELGPIARRYGLHPLSVEDAVLGSDRSKLVHHDDGLSMVFQTVSYGEHGQRTATGEVAGTGDVMVFLGRNYVITIRHGEYVGLREVQRGLEERRDLLRLGPAAVLYAVADRVVDGFREVVGELDEDIDDLEASVSTSEQTDGVGGVSRLRPQLVALRRPLRSLLIGLEQLSSEPISIVPRGMSPYFRDVGGHARAVLEETGNLDELLSSILDASIARSSQVDTGISRQFAAWAAIIAVPTLITGIYGMNFQYMPELHWRVGYAAVLLLIVIVSWVLYRGFKRNGWL